MGQHRLIDEIVDYFDNIAKKTIERHVSEHYDDCRCDTLPENLYQDEVYEGDGYTVWCDAYDKFRVWHEKGDREDVETSPLVAALIQKRLESIDYSEFVNDLQRQIKDELEEDDWKSYAMWQNRI